MRPTPSLSRSTALRLIAAAVLLCSAAVAARAQSVCGTPGKDGPASSLSGVVNSYWPGAASAAAGATSIQLGTIRADGSATTIANGDLLLVIQVQDGTFNSTNGTAYGANNGTGRGATSAGAAGQYEYVVATGNSGGNGAITIRGLGAGNGLVNGYTNAAPNTTAGAGAQGQRRFQVVRVPQYSSATIGGTITAPAWDGSTGGVVAFDVAGTLTLNSGVVNVNVTGLGFRGGGGRPLTGGRAVPGGGNPQPTATDYAYISSSPATAVAGAHGSKGEGIAGRPRYVFNPVTNSVEELSPTAEGYPNGSYARGAPGNAGGGGTDSSPSNNEQNSGGGGGANGGDGGRGGNTWNLNSAIGGLGGVKVANAAGRAVMGGGGGAGSRNNSVNFDSSGASGGGVVMLRVHTVSGSGTINADGDAAWNNTANDGGGGGGAGGSVVVTATTPGGTLAGLTINARGGRGGDAWRNSNPAGATLPDRHGPGGGGGGGFVAHTGGAAATVTGGQNGLTTTLADAYNATAGENGVVLSITQAQVPGVRSGAQCVPLLTVTKTTSTATVNNTPAGAAATYTITVANAANRVPATAGAVSDALPAGFAYASTGSVNLAGGATRSPTVDPTAGDAVPAWSVFQIPGGASVSITFTVSVASTVAGGTYQNPAAFTYSDPQRTAANGTTVASYDPASSTNEDVTVVAPPKVDLCKTFPGQICIPGGPEPSLPPQMPGAEITYVIKFDNTGGRAARGIVLTDPLPADTDLKVGSVQTNLGSTGLTVAVFYSYDNGANFVTTPPTSGGGGAPAGYDRSVTHVRWVFTGDLSHTSPNNAGSVQFVSRIR